MRNLFKRLCEIGAIGVVLGTSLAHAAITPTAAPAPIALPKPLAPQAAAPAAAMPPASLRPVAAPAAMPAALMPLMLHAGSGKVVSLHGAASNIFVADPKVVEVRPASASTLFIFGITPGQTTVAVMDNAGHVLAAYDLTVEPSDFGARSAAMMIRRLVPGSHVQVHTDAKGLLLTGSVVNPNDAARAVAIAKAYAPDAGTIDDQITISMPIQVTLRVRIAEMSREVVRNLGLNWAGLANFGQIGRLGSQISYSSTATGVTAPGACPNCPGVGFLGVIDALSKDNLAQILAEPNLTVMSGQPAKFQVGGEYPIPVASGNSNQITVTYKKFGVLLSFLPTVLSNGKINLHVAPEVSDLNTANSITTANGGLSITIPGLNVRSVDTTVELGSGESFAIAGLLQQNTADNGSGIPGAGDLPVMGALFRDSQFQRTETELVIVVTPYIVRPVANPAALHLPTDNYVPPTDLQRLLFMRQMATNEPPVPVRIPGDAGFMVQ